MKKQISTYRNMLTPEELNELKEDIRKDVEYIKQIFPNVTFVDDITNGKS